MCDPLTITGIALTGLSTGLNSAAQAQVGKARSESLSAERIRQNALDRQADAINANSQKTYENFGTDQAAKTQQLSDYFTGQVAAPPSSEAALPTSSSNIVVNEQNKQNAATKAFTDQQGKALGNLRAFGDLLGDNSRLQARDANLVGQIGSFKNGSQGVLPYELEAASHAGDGLKTFADLAGGAGSIFTGIGLSGPAKIAGAAGTAASTAGTGLGASGVANFGAAPIRLNSLYRHW